MDDTRILSRERLDEIWARAHTVVAGGPHANAGDDLFALLAHSKALESQRDHYHTEWTARGTALLQLHQDIEAEQKRSAAVIQENLELEAKMAGFTQEDVEFLRLVAGQWRALRLGDHQLIVFEGIAARIAALAALHHVHLSASSTEAKGG